MKECVKCNIKVSKKWYSGPLCQKCYHASRYQRDKDRILSSQDPERKRKNAKERYQRKRQEILYYQKDFYLKNKDRLLEKQKSYYEKNKDARIEWQIKREKERIKTDIPFLLRKRIRSRLRVAMKNNYKSGLAIESLGCSIEELKAHLERQFTEGMSWSNYGKGWEIDHIIPLAKFNLSDPEQIKKACNFMNLQPLWKEDHYKKSQKDRNSR